MLLTILGTALTTAGLTVSTWIFYNLYLHPLAKYPGPWAWRAFRFSMLQEMLGGRLPHRIRELHRQYGPILRVAPDEVSVCMPEAWTEIYGRREYLHPPQWRGKPPGETANSLIQADAPTHARLKKAFSPAFYERAVRGYAPSINAHVTVLLAKLHARAAQGPVDLMKWLNFCSFDTTMDIGWNAEFALLEQEKYHPWFVATQSYKALLFGVALAYYPSLANFAERNMPMEARDSLKMIMDIARFHVQQRLALETDRRDIFANTLGKNQDLAGAGLTQDEMVANSMNYVIAGGESVTTVLTAAIHHLLLNPECLKILSSEVRGAFRNASEVEGPACQQLLFYQDAVLKEALRLCPTVPDGMRREVPDDGVIICEQALPKHTVVSVPTWTIFTSHEYWSEARTFRPERWLTAPVVAGGLCAQNFPKDDRRTYHPFGYGPRSCIGTNLGWEQMRVVLARLIFDFDLTVPKGETMKPWESQNIHWVWEKRPLMTTLTPVRAAT